MLVGAAGSGKSTWARSRYRDDEVVFSDALRGVVGGGPHDLEASRRERRAACAPDRRAGTGAEQRDRYVALADLGVDTVFVGVVDLEGPGDVSRLAPMTA